MAGVLMGNIIGAVITVVVAWYYYKRAGDELREESAKLRKLMSIMLTAMERQGLAKLNRDASGNIIGFDFEHAATGGAVVGGEATVEFSSSQPNANESNGNAT